MNDLYWHFLGGDRRMRYPPYTLVEAGQTYTAEGPLAICQNGMHACAQVLDALCYAPGGVVCRVRLSGERVADADMVCARERTVLWMADAGMLLHEFACAVAERALAEVAARGMPVDQRLVAAIAAKRAWLRGELSNAGLDAAREGAWRVFLHSETDVGCDAALFADRVASRDAGSDVAWSATRAAARSSARDAAADAAWAAARAMAGDTANEAERAAARDAGHPERIDAADAAWAAAYTAAWLLLDADLERILLALGPAEGTAS